MVPNTYFLEVFVQTIVDDVYPHPALVLREAGEILAGWGNWRGGAYYCFSSWSRQ